MPRNRLFISQDTLDSWIDQRRAKMEENRLTLAEEQKTYLLAPAVYFVHEATGAEDPHRLVGRVKEESQLTILGADAYMDSVLLEDNAYDVKRGFVAVPVHSTAIEQPEEAPASGPDSGASTGTDDALAAFLLQHIK